MNSNIEYISGEFNDQELQMINNLQFEDDCTEGNENSQEGYKDKFEKISEEECNSDSELEINIKDINHITSNKNIKDLYLKEKSNKFQFKPNMDLILKNDSVDVEYKNEIQDCLNVLGDNFKPIKPARGRGRITQLKKLSRKEIEVEQKVRLIKNKYSAKKTRINKNIIAGKKDSKINFLEEKIKKYEKMLGKIFET
jgi:hypothetical protein